MSIRLDNVSFTYLKNTSYETKALDNVSLEIKDGEFVGIIGETGSGKSTLLDIIAGLNSPTEGKVSVEGRVGVVFQFVEKQLFESTVYKDVGFSIGELSNDEKEKRIRETLEYLDFNYEKVKDMSPFEFSIGEKRKIAIAGVLVSRPDILILDEVFAGLDYDGKKSLINILNDLNLRGTTIILISHSADIICECATRTVVLKDGTIYKDGKSSEVLKDYDFYIPRLSKRLNLSCIKYSELLEEIEKRYTHE